MSTQKKSNKITRRESLKIGAGLVAGFAAASTGFGALAIENNKNAQFASIQSNLLKEFTNGTRSVASTLDWVQDLLVIAMPAAAVGGCQAGIYTAAENGVRPWRQAIIRWYTSRNVRGNGGVLVRQEGKEGGAGLKAIIDPNADYIYEVSVYSSSGLQAWATVLDTNDRIVSEESFTVTKDDWIHVQVSFNSGLSRQVKCIVQVKSPEHLPCIYAVEGFRLFRRDYLWWNPQNFFNSSRTVAILRDERDVLISSIDPDVVGGHNGMYLNGDQFYSRNGIAVGGGHWEQEFNHLAIDDPMVEQFRNDGIARELDGKEVLGGKLWPGYHMCHNNPGWHSYHKNRLARIAPEVHVISQDNLSVWSFLKWGKNGCFCRGCRNSFRDWLRQHWNANQFRTNGIDNPGSFDIAEYVKKVKMTILSKGTDAVLQDPVLRAYVQFQYASHLDLWRDTVADVKQAAGHPVAIGGNQWGANGVWPSAVALSQTVDYIFTEGGGGSLDASKRAEEVLSSKLSFAAGEYRRPVWLCMSGLMQSPQAAKSRLRLANSEVLASGGLPMTWSTAPGATGWYYNTEASIYQFVQKHRALFSRRETCANVGLVYSLPTHAWRNFPVFGLSSAKYQQWFVSCARIMEELHIPYEVNCWWHPLLGDDTISMERLDRYKVLVLPGVDCFTDEQREAVHKFQLRGGKVISLKCTELCNKDAVRRNDNLTLVKKDHTLTEIAPDLLAGYIEATRDPSSGIIMSSTSVSKRLKSIFAKAMNEAEILETDAPETVWNNLSLTEDRKVFALHLVNGNIDVENDRFHSVENSQWKVRLPEGLPVDKAILLSPDKPDKPEPIPVKVRDGWATVVVPEIESYTIVTLFSGDAMEEAEEKARERREYMKSVIRGFQMG